MLRRSALTGFGFYWCPLRVVGRRRPGHASPPLRRHVAVRPGGAGVHHHAPVGGLRTHGARACCPGQFTPVAHPSFLRNLPSVTQLYLGLRYATAEQRREARAINLFSTMSTDGPASRLIHVSVAQAVSCRRRCSGETAGAGRGRRPCGDISPRSRDSPTPRPDRSVRPDRPAVCLALDLAATPSVNGTATARRCP